MYFNLTYFDKNSKPIEVEIICDKCGKIIKTKNISKFDVIKSDYCIIKNNENIVCECGNIGTGLIGFKRNQELKKTICYTQKTNIPKCPTCQSTNIQKISGTSKVASVALWGIFSQKVKKTYHCNNCGYEW